MKKQTYSIMSKLPVVKTLMLLTHNIPWSPYTPINNLYVSHEPLSDDIIKKVEAFTKEHPDELLTYKLIKKKFM